MNIKFKRLHPAAIMPAYQSPGAACFDLHSLDAGEVGPYASYVMRTGLAVELPQGHAMLIYSRSGHGFKHGIRLSNAVGVVDSDFRGEIAVALQNDTGIAFDFPSGARMAQAMVLPVPCATLEEVLELSETARGEGGFGSTGR